MMKISLSSRAANLVALIAVLMGMTPNAVASRVANASFSQDQPVVKSVRTVNIRVGKKGRRVMEDLEERSDIFIAEILEREMGDFSVGFTQETATLAKDIRKSGIRLEGLIIDFARKTLANIRK